MNENIKWIDIESAFNCRVRTAIITNLKHIDFRTFLNDCAKSLKNKIKNILRNFPMLKINANFCGNFVKNNSM